MVRFFDVAERPGYIRKPKVGWYEAINPPGEVLTESFTCKTN